jgi:hypothetical protein
VSAVAAFAAGAATGTSLSTYEEPLRICPPREGMRPGTAAGDPQTPF